MTVVIPRSADSSARMRLTSCLTTGSSPSKVSSQRRQDGVDAIPSMTDACFFMPFEKDATFLSQSSLNISRIFAKVLSEKDVRTARSVSFMSFIEQCGRKYCSSGRYTIFWRTFSFSNTGSPPTMTSPDAGFMIPHMVLRSVDFPEPFEPMSPKIEPSPITAFMLSRDFSFA